MRMERYTSEFVKRLLSAGWIVILPLIVVNQTQAKSPGRAPVVLVVSLANLSGTNIKNSNDLKARLLYLTSHNPKAVKALSKGCGCPAGAPQDSVGFGSCLKNCMADVGVSTYALIMCAGACALAETPPGIIACALCVGVSVTVVEACAIGCAISGGKGYGMIEDARNIERHRSTSGSLQAKIRLKPLKSGS